MQGFHTWNHFDLNAYLHDPRHKMYYNILRLQLQASARCTNWNHGCFMAEWFHITAFTMINILVNIHQRNERDIPDCAQWDARAWITECMHTIWSIIWPCTFMLDRSWHVEMGCDGSVWQEVCNQESLGYCGGSVCQGTQIQLQVWRSSESPAGIDIQEPRWHRFVFFSSTLFVDGVLLGWQSVKTLRMRCSNCTILHISI